MSLLLALLGPTSSQLVGTPLLSSTNSFFVQILQLEATTPSYTFEGYGTPAVTANSISATYITGETVFVVVNLQGSTRPTAVSDGTNTYTLVGGNTTGNYSIAVFKADNVIGGTYTLNSATNATVINYYRYRNIKAGTAQVVITGEITNPGSTFPDNVVLPTITPTTSPAMVFIAGGDQNAGGLYVGSSFNGRDSGNIQSVAGDRRVTTTDTITPKFSGSGFEWTDYVVAVFSEALIVSKWLYPRTIESTNAFFVPTVVAAGGTQTLTPGLLDNSINNTYYTPTISVTGGGTQTLTPGLYSNTTTYYNATVTTGAITLTPSLYSNSNTYYGPTITTGAVTLTPSLYSNSNTYYNATITTGAVTLTPSLYTNSNTYFAPTISVGTVTLQDPLYTNSNTLFVPTITTGVVTLTPSLYTNTNTYYTPTITVTGFSTTLSPPLLTNTNALYTPSVLKAAVITEDWTGSGSVSGKTPTTGGGTWEVVTALGGINYGESGVPRAGISMNAAFEPTGSNAVFRHSIPLVNATISTVVSIDQDYESPVYLWVRSTPGPNGEITDGYYARINFYDFVVGKRISGSDTDLFYVGQIASGYPISFSVSGSAITIRLNNFVVIDSADTSIATAGYFGCELTTTYGFDSWIYTFVGPVNIQPAITSSLSPALYSNSNTYYNPTIMVGGVTLQDPLYTNTNTLYTPTITKGVVTVTPSLYSNSNNYYVPTITTGVVTLTPSLYSNTNTYYSPTITVGAVTLTPSLYSNTNTYYSPTITVGVVTLTPSVYTNSNTLYGANVGAVQALTAPLLTNTSSYYTPAITVGVTTVSPALYSNTNNLYTPTITRGAVTVTAPLLSNTNTLVAPTILPGVISLAPPVITSSNVYYLPTVTRGVVTVAPALFTNTTTYYTPSIIPGAVGIQAPTIASNSATYAPTVYGTAAGITPGNIVVDVPSANVASYTETTNWVPTLVVNNVVTFLEVPHYIVNVNGEHAVTYSDSLDYILDKPSGSVSK